MENKKVWPKYQISIPIQKISNLLYKYISTYLGLESHAPLRIRQDLQVHLWRLNRHHQRLVPIALSPPQIRKNSLHQRSQRLSRFQRSPLHDRIKSTDLTSPRLDKIDKVWEQHVQSWIRINLMCIVWIINVWTISDSLSTSFDSCSSAILPCFSTYSFPMTTRKSLWNHCRISTAR